MPLSGIVTAMNRVGRAAAAGLSAVAAVAARDLLQREHTLLRNFPVIGHARYLLEEIGPELRQYLVAGNNEERPFTRDQRRWVYASAKKANNYFGFGTDNDLEYTAGYPGHQPPDVRPGGAGSPRAGR
jgi:glutamate synthase domain-containing protein 2